MFETGSPGLNWSFNLFLTDGVYRVSSTVYGLKSVSWLKIVDGAQSAAFNAFLLSEFHGPLPEDYWCEG